MQETGDHLFAHPALPLQQDRRIGIGYLLDPFRHFSHNLQDYFTSRCLFSALSTTSRTRTMSKGFLRHS
jgi:hypothetical protein